MLAAIGPNARLAHVDCALGAPPGESALARGIRTGLASAPVTSFAYGTWFATNSRGDAVYRTRPCICCNLGLQSVADLVDLAARPRIPTYAETGAEMRAIRCATDLQREHARLRRDVARDPAAAPALDAFLAGFTDLLGAGTPCRTGAGARLRTLGVGIPALVGGNPADVEAMLSGAVPATGTIRDDLLDGMTDAALRDTPVGPAAGAHLGLLYLIAARAELDDAVRSVRGDRRLNEVALHELPIPRGPRERAAAMICRADGVHVLPGRSALETLAGQPRAARVMGRDAAVTAGSTAVSASIT